ncbi:MAG: MBL fold metallo-hydrolase [Acetobacteraceae bacterium]|nr:MBL fold metallo-hydrolase [Acetobacteraceae bacterium]
MPPLPPARPAERCATSTNGRADRAGTPILKHFDGERFFNPHAPGGKTADDLRRWRRERVKLVWPKRVVDPLMPPPVRVAPDRIAVTFIGHSSFLVQVGGIAVLLDPIWSARCSPLQFAGPRRVRPPGQKLEALPDVDLLLVSHNHYDHMDLGTLRRVQRRWHPPVATGLGNARHLAKAGIRTAVELDWWDTTEIAGARVTYVPAQHFSARTLYDRNRCLWGGFVVEAGGAAVYFAGDSGYCPHFAEIGRRFPNIDVALLPIGAYEPRWFMRQQHVNPEEAVQAHLDLQPRRSIGMHFGTFQLTDEAIDAPVLALREARAQAGIPEADFDVMAFGETRDYPTG